MDWGFLWLFLVLKIPLAACLWLIWWAVRAVPEPADEPPVDDEGGRGPDHPRGPLRPRPPRRGPHADPLPPAPRRVRARGRRLLPDRH